VLARSLGCKLSLRKGTIPIIMLYHRTVVVLALNLASESIYTGEGGGAGIIGVCFMWQGMFVFCALLSFCLCTAWDALV